MIPLSLTLSGLLVLSSLYVLIPLLNVLSLEMQSPLYLAAYANTGFSLFYSIGFLFVGAMIPKYGTKRILIYGMFCLAIATWITGFVKSMEVLILLRAVQGFIAATFAPAALTYIADHYPPQKGIVVMSWVTTGFIAAGIVGQIIASIVEEYLGWQWIFWILAFAYLIFALLNNFLLTNSPQVSSKKEDILPIVKQLMLNADLRKAYFAAITLLLSFVALYSSLDKYLFSKFHLNPQEAFYIRTIGIAGIVGSFFVPKLAKKLPFHKIVASGISIMLISLIVTALAGSAVWVQIALIIFVAGLLMTIPSIITLIGQLAGKDRGMAVTLYTFILFVGASIGPVVANVGGFLAVTSILVVLLSVALGAVLRIMPKIQES